MTDQLGQPRVGPCDIGSIEFQGGSFVAAVNAGSSINGGFVSASFDRLVATGEVERVVEAVVEANRRIADPKNSEEVIEEIITVFGFDRALAEQFHRQLVGSLTLNGTVEIDKVKRAIEIARSSLE